MLPINQTPTIEIFDINGRLVYEMPVGADPRVCPSPGRTHGCAPTDIVWRPGESITSGIYLVRAKIGDKSLTKRVVYLK